MAYVQLKLFSQFSIGKGIIQIPQLITKAKKYHISALALTDSNNLFAAVNFYKATYAAGIKPIIAAQVSYKHSEDPRIYELCLYCKNDLGYLNLSKIISRIYQTRSEKIYSQNSIKTGFNLDDDLWVDADYLFEHTAGLIAVNGGEYSDLSHAIDVPTQLKYLKKWQNYFKDDFYLQVHNLTDSLHQNWLYQAIGLADEHKIAVVGTHPIYFLDKEDFNTHQIRTCIDQKIKLDSLANQTTIQKNQYLLNQEQFHQLFADFDQNIIKNNEIIAQKCNFKFRFGEPQTPKFKTKNGQSEEQYLVDQSLVGLTEKIKELKLNQKQEKEYFDRLYTELEVIKKVGFSGYFLVVADYVNWAKNNAVPVGPGRGSGAGSLVAYALNITDIDPLKYQLIFERFLTPDRTSMPDFDIDFCAYKREQVLDYIRSKYKKQIPVQIITFGTLKSKAVVRDVARVLSYPYSLGDRIAKEVVEGFSLKQLISDKQQVLKERLIQWKKNIEQADENNQEIRTETDIHNEVQEFFVKAAKFQELYHGDEEVKNVVDQSIKLEGLVRNVGTHAGGVLIAPKDIRHFCPIYCDQEKPDHLISQFEMKSAEQVGLIKFDFLGIKALSVIEKANQLIQQKSGKTYHFYDLKTNNKQVYTKIRQGLTCGIFQLESRGIKRMLSKMKIDCFDELVASIALYRPGPLGSNMDQMFIDIKLGRAKAEYIFPELKTILADTKGVLIYQEQVMKIAQIICNYSLASADILRKAMGKKDAGIMDQQRRKFINGGLKNGYDREKLEKLFNQIYEFASYGFNKSHTVAYALVSYLTAYLKTFYPAIFYACEMNENFNNSNELKTRILEIPKFNATIRLEKPDINQSQYLFEAKNDDIIHYGLGAIKGVGQQAAQEIANQRINGAFQSLTDFCLRVDLAKVNKRSIASLIYAGAMDEIKPLGRKVKIDNLIELMKAVAEYKKSSLKGMKGLFAEDSNCLFNFDYQIYDYHDFAFFEQIEHEFKTFGYYPELSPLDAYSHQFSFLNNLIKVDQLNNLKLRENFYGDYYIFAFVDYFGQRVRADKIQGQLRIADANNESYELSMDLEQFKNYQETLRNNKQIVCKISINSNRITFLELFSLAEFRTDKLNFMIDLNTNKLPIEDLSQKLKHWFSQSSHFGQAQLFFKINQDDNQFLLSLGEDYCFYPTDEHISQLEYLSLFNLKFANKF